MSNILLLIAAYLTGSISSAIIISRLKGLEDPRKVGSGNPGATNVLRSGDKTAAVLTLLGDILKGFIPVLVAKLLGVGPIWVAGAGLAAFLGHLYPVYYGFKGGKGVATAAGVILGLNPLSVLIMILIWVAVAWRTGYSSLAALIAAVASPLFIAQITHINAYTALAAIIALFLVWRHKANIKRLLDGTESKISFGKK